jgi:hypothetical protein
MNTFKILITGYTVGCYCSIPYIADKSYTMTQNKDWPLYGGLYLGAASVIVWPISVPFFMTSNKT